MRALGFKKKHYFNVRMNLGMQPRCLFNTIYYNFESCAVIILAKVDLTGMSYFLKFWKIEVNL